VDLPRDFTIREASHRIHNPFTKEKLATLGRALRPAPGTTVLDLACGSGEMLCTWARDLRLTGTGVDLSTVFIDKARTRAQLRAERNSAPARHVRYRREYLGWGVFALMDR
jgi:cyclopropane fatty-acyl-phospholipid synthase-like methyltransferase